MERLRYNLSRNVLEEMIKFVPKSEDEDSPKFLLQIKMVIPQQDRYILNVIDGTNLEILCLTSAEYSEIFPAEDVIDGTLIRILDYWVFQIECHVDDENERQFQYIIMISNAEIIPVAKTIVSITRVTSKTPRVYGIVDAYFGVSHTHHGEPLVRFRLRDHTGSIGCSASGAMYASLHSILEEGVRVQLSHAMVTKIDPGPEMRDNSLELKLNQFSILKIYDADNLNLLFSYSLQDIVEKLSDERLEVESSGTSFNQSSAISKLPEPTVIPAPTSSNPLFRSSLSEPSTDETGSNQKMNFELNQQKFLPAHEILNAMIRAESCELESNQPNSSREHSLTQRKPAPPRKPSTILPSFIQRECFDGKTPVPIESLTQPGVCRFWIRGMVERQIQLNSINTLFHLRDQSSAIRCTVLQPASEDLNKILKNRMILEISNFDVEPVSTMSINPEHSHELVLTKFATIRAMAPDNSVIYHYRIPNSTFMQLGKIMTQKESPKSLEDLVPKLIDGVLSMNISSVQTAGICSSWIRGVVEYYGGLENTHAHGSFMRFFIRDNTAIIRCFVWQQICSSLTPVLKENMIIEAKNYTVAPVKNLSEVMIHNFQLYMSWSTTIRLFSGNDTIVYEHSPS